MPDVQPLFSSITPLPQFSPHPRYRPGRGPRQGALRTNTVLGLAGKGKGQPASPGWGRRRNMVYVHGDWLFTWDYSGGSREGSQVWPQLREGISGDAARLSVLDLTK